MHCLSAGEGAAGVGLLLASRSLATGPERTPEAPDGLRGRALSKLVAIVVLAAAFIMHAYQVQVKR